MNLGQDEKHEYEFQMVSFVDVIFVLLSFFVLGTHFIMPERDFGMGYTQATLAAGARAEDFPSSVQVELRRTPGGVGITVGKARLAENDFGAIRSKLTEINMPQMGVLVLADPALSVDQVARAMDSALASPMKRLSVARLPQAGVTAAGSDASGTVGDSAEGIAIARR
ncbi:MAG: ExbD/TolR family protein [Phycisphaerae bacterium]